MSHAGKWHRVGDTIIYELVNYHDSSMYLTMLGRDSVHEAVEELRGHRLCENGVIKLFHVPKTTAMKLKNSPFTTHVVHDRTNDDYILSTERLSALNHGALKKKKSHITKFIKDHPGVETYVVNHALKSVKTQMYGVFKQWITHVNPTAWHIEHNALQRLLELDHPAVVLIGTFDGKRMIGFTLNELEKKSYYQGHFGKASRNYPNLSAYIEHKTAQIMRDTYHCKYMNMQQDLGLPGLEAYKSSWEPIKKLRKYTVTINYNSQ